MSAITIESGNVKIPVESIEGNGLAVITLAQNTFLIVRAEDLPSYPPALLTELYKTAQSIQPVSPDYNLYSPQKARALRELRALGYDVSGGEEHFKELVTNPPLIEQVRKELGSIKGSLSDRVISQRDER